MKWLILILVLAACGTTAPVGDTAGQAATSTPIPTAPAVARPTYVVQRGTVQETLTFSGRWRPRDQQALSFEIAGSIRRVEVQRGDAVSAGQLLADYQINDLEDQLANALLDLESARNALENDEDGIVQTVEDAQLELLNAQLALDEALANSPWTSVASSAISLEQAQRSLDEARRDYNTTISDPTQPASSIEAAYRALLNAESNLRSSQISYSGSAQSFNNYEFTIISAENRVTLAEIELERALTGDGSDSNAVDNFQNSQLNVDQIEADIARSSLFAPFDGEILEVSIQPGATVDAFETVIVIAIPEPREIIAEIPVNQANQLNVGRLGVCTVFNQPDTAVQCAIRQFPLSARDADQTTRVVADFGELPSETLIEVNMPLDVREDVLWLPPAAIRTFQNRVFVVLETEDGPVRVDVQLGLQTDDRVEIVSGLNEGDVVVGQ